MLHKLLFCLLLALTISSCRGKIADNEMSNQDGSKVTSVDEEKPQEFKPIENEATAEAINKQNEALAVSSEEVIEVSDKVYFDLDNSGLSPDAKKVLDNQVAWLKSDTSIKVVIEGHCDERGTREYNIALGAKRANSIKNYLVQGGIINSRVRVVSYGKERPAAVGTGEAVWSKNRRAVTTIQ